ncbi:MAG: tetratricopeptide repeat protein [Bacteroidota bacterium]
MRRQVLSIMLILLFTLASFTLQSQTSKDFARMAKAKIDLKDYKGAIDDFSSIIRLQPEYETLYQAYYGRGYAKFLDGNFKGAKSDFDRAIKIYPNDAQVFFWRAYTKYRLRYKASSEIADYNRAILLNPDYAEAYFNRGHAKIKNRQPRSGCKDLKKALELGYQEAETHVKIHCGTP